ncbi:MAG TPA: hypothetical protein VFC74_01090 [Oscillospiraceae bacterium]|nr:hypothetical protein [Oscillospiraceae bacterium]
MPRTDGAKLTVPGVDLLTYWGLTVPDGTQRLTVPGVDLFV